VYFKASGIDYVRLWFLFNALVLNQKLDDASLTSILFIPCCRESAVSECVPCARFALSRLQSREVHTRDRSMLLLSGVGEIASVSVTSSSAADLGLNILWLRRTRLCDCLCWVF